MNTDKEILIRAIWLAFNSSVPVGLGVLHMAAARAVTEDNILENCSAVERDGRLEVYVDYLCGRMMKTHFSVKDGELSFGKSEPNIEYQSWCGKYETYEDLKEAVKESFKKTPAI